MQRVKEMVSVDAKVHQDACSVQPGEEGHLDQVAISEGSAADGSIVGVAEEASTSARAGQRSWKSCSAPSIRCQTVVQPQKLQARRWGGVLTWYLSLVLLNLSVAESFAFRA